MTKIAYGAYRVFWAFRLMLVVIGALAVSAAIGLAVSAAFAKDEEILNLEQSLNTVQDFSKNKRAQKIPQILRAGKYDEAYDYYVQGFYLKAFRAALRRAENNDPKAQTLVGKMYMEGYAVTQDGARAALWFGRAAKQGDPHAQLRYGLMLFNGNFVKKNEEEGEKLIHEAMQAGLKEAYFYCGQLLLYKTMREKENLKGVAAADDNDENSDKALAFFLKGAALGDAEAAFAAAQILAVGTMKYPRHDHYARRLMTIAAQKKHVMAQMMLAQWLLQGRGGEADFKEAFSLLYDNALKRVMPAQVNLARVYRDGLGVEGDIVTAAAWYLVVKSGKGQAADLEMMLEGMSQAQLEQAHQKAYELMQLF
ncbi:hypothetical protein X471_00808 [Bartonella bacilliformis str. Heidi Mejia]|uniref:Sel1 repeat family protein n=2 Tax=Bartonella bacilliformis TaxID=774 RepID=A1UR91_BARBK|nr:conserved hypothetical protein [Bartonella bacilliformis KC583]EYS89104.1 hypothetical protein X472_00804 [Bartonella bacilliformis San Pedro600-02]EYS91210.1 hypothetical protein X471_00808 [Bartonella bacilliformis str. Heidi Mejia]EYS95826.1 hypothetical protein X470_00003 [Bartonella bacilliformis Peru-18]KEG17915.1 hypothetical protein H705_00147 [Bartonella bacilliformis Cond044]KEG18227.1 hypothetical protein H709_00149 [Bartonella bacilliformis CUSCO5]KEG20362.1 hypothetical protei